MIGRQRKLNILSFTNNQRKSGQQTTFPFGKFLNILQELQFGHFTPAYRNCTFFGNISFISRKNCHGNAATDSKHTASSDDFHPKLVVRPPTCSQRDHEDAHLLLDDSRRHDLVHHGAILFAGVLLHSHKHEKLHHRQIMKKKKKIIQENGA